VYGNTGSLSTDNNVFVNTVAVVKYSLLAINTSPTVKSDKNTVPVPITCEIVSVNLFEYNVLTTIEEYELNNCVEYVLIFDDVTVPAISTNLVVVESAILLLAVFAFAGVIITFKVLSVLSKRFDASLTV